MTLYTAIVGNYDDLKTPLIITPGWKYVVFTDQPLVSDVWELRKCSLSGGPRRTSKLYKIMFHQFVEDDVSMWVDASFIVNCDLNKWMKRFKPPFTLMQHPKRNCVYQEALACIKNRRDHPEVIRQQVERYRRVGLPVHNGMAATGIMIRERCASTIDFAKIWHQELTAGCMRDQISWAYANWKCPGVAHLTDYNYREGTDFLHVPHLRASESKRKARLDHFKKQGLI